VEAPSPGWARWQNLSLDAGSVEAMADFWTEALELHVHERHDEAVWLQGDSPASDVWLLPVPEPKTVKNRVHLDLCLDDAQREWVLGRGGSVVRAAGPDLPWWILADPDGGELCVWPPDPGGLRWAAVAVDHDGDCTEVARWWALAFGGRVVPAPGGALRWVQDIPGVPFETFSVSPVPEPKTGKNRIHWDVVARLDDALAAGASVLRERDGQITWDVCADPWGNEFCVFLPRDPEDAAGAS
jgi:hypothetical protein